jgi:hypothetical protein
MKKFCTACGHVGNPVLVQKGSTGTAFLLWITFLLPGIIYSIWRANSEHEACPACGSPQVIPVDSPMSQKLMGDDYKKMKDAEVQAAEELRVRAAEALEEFRAREAADAARPWIQRYGLAIGIPIVIVMVGGLVIYLENLSAQYHVSAPTTTTQLATEAPKPKKVERHKQSAKAKQAAAAEVAAAKREAACKEDYARDPFTRSPNCEYPESQQ